MKETILGSWLWLMTLHGKKLSIDIGEISLIEKVQKNKFLTSKYKKVGGLVGCVGRKKESSPCFILKQSSSFKYL
jgi:hypothetical protein